MTAFVRQSTNWVLWSCCELARPCSRRCPLSGPPARRFALRVSMAHRIHLKSWPPLRILTFQSVDCPLWCYLPLPLSNMGLTRCVLKRHSRR